MATGHFLCVGDKTSCGGEIVEGYAGWICNGRPRARAGDAVTCGADGEVYRILGGVSFQILDGKPAAGTLDSVSGCPCSATFFPSSFAESYTHHPAPSRSHGLAPLSLEPMPGPSWASKGPVPVADSTGTVASAEAEEPGFYVVPKTTTYETLETELFPSPSMAVLHKFRALNPRRGQVKAGELIVLSDPNNQRCTYEESLLMGLSAEIHAEVADVSPEAADFAAEHHEQIQRFLDYGSKGIGAAEAMLGQHIHAIEKISKEIEQLHVKTFLLHGNLRSQDFLAERRKLLSQLDARLGGLTRKGIGFPDHPKLKAALGLSSRSMVHHWTKAGAAGQIPGYATHFAGTTAAGEWIKRAGIVGIFIGAGASYTKVQEVCRSGETEACRRVRVTETAAFTGSVAGGILGGIALKHVAGGICLGLGIPTAGMGTIACSLVIVGLGGVGLGILGGLGGEIAGNVIYEHLQ
jgi:uncharacterized Zn-binding protein involved in type VI secretion